MNEEHLRHARISIGLPRLAELAKKRDEAQGIKGKGTVFDIIAGTSIGAMNAEFWFAML